MRPKPTHPSRAGFTLVELLIVITIIAILVGLSAAAVVKVIGKGDEARVRNEISQLNAAVQAFKTDFQVSYLPSRLTLPPAFDMTGDGSAQYISTLWPRIDPVALSQTPAAYTFWGLPANTLAKLNGHQTLVFFLGGVNSGGAPIGFSSSARNPMDPNGTTRKGPYFDFPLDRLKPVPAGNPFRSFMDVYGTQPYLYFSSNKAGIYDGTTDPSFPTIQPYQTLGNPQRFANPNGFQIICAGKNGVFGRGGISWAGATGGGATEEGYDDMSNFYPTLLGISQ